MGGEREVGGGATAPPRFWAGGGRRLCEMPMCVRAAPLSFLGQMRVPKTAHDIFFLFFFFNRFVCLFVWCRVGVWADCIDDAYAHVKGWMHT